MNVLPLPLSHRPPVPSALRIAQRILTCRLARGWDLGVLAARAGISRTTLYHLQHGKSRVPRLSTLQRIADAFGISLERLLYGEETAANEGFGRDSREFDRLTNRAVREVVQEFPACFTGWNESEWDELYSTFGTGGELTPAGVMDEARRINARRETLRQLTVVLETELSDVARTVVESLYRMVIPEGNLAPSRELHALIRAHQNESDRSAERANFRPESDDSDDPAGGKT